MNRLTPEAIDRAIEFHEDTCRGWDDQDVRCERSAVLALKAVKRVRELGKRPDRTKRGYSVYYEEGYADAIEFVLAALEGSTEGERKDG